ncbi:MAG: endonuclease III [Candidatus Brocadia sp.]|nr:endonuclease III [Candidatus Brocadia sp.]MCE7912089.1 endonuclease III [Candidatus Brocadia sp. AMX3]OQZ01073.1 MAG: endonuclease III [Candidatus Brocadia sp. UTAMX2]MDG5997219.1 endonuclease III [Candidatus Brocadia sp.]RIJ99690.1 MAG: endonuclease III [Candidatus Brocadia sp.]
MFDIQKALRSIEQENKRFVEPIVTTISRERTPFHVLISCILSLRTKDQTTREASNRLFALADNPEEMVKIPPEKLEKIIYPVGFYRIKARKIKEICAVLIQKYAGKVPDEIDELLKLNGVGRKTANLVVTLGYQKPGICVDTHVHRITNRWGYVQTRNPHETEFALREKLPKKYWLTINDLLVTFGQNICVPISPKCSICPVTVYCKKVEVTRSR